MVAIATVVSLRGPPPAMGDTPDFGTVIGKSAFPSGQLYALYTADPLKLGRPEPDATQTPDLVGTGSHPVYSVTRQQWTELSRLQPGETVLSMSGPIEVTAVEAVPGVRWVHNLEIHGAHEYTAGEIGLRVHNNNCWRNIALRLMGEPEIPRWMEGHNPHGHHIIPWDMQDVPGARGEIVTELQSLGRRNGLTSIRDDDWNLTVAPNGLGTHSEAGLRRLLDRLAPFDGDSDGFLQEMDTIRNEMFNGDFYRQLGTFPEQ